MAEVAELKEFVDEVHDDLSRIQKEFSDTVTNINMAFRDIDGLINRFFCIPTHIDIYGECLMCPQWQVSSASTASKRSCIWNYSLNSVN